MKSVRTLTGATLVLVTACTGGLDEARDGVDEDLSALPYLEFVDVEDPDASGVTINDPERAQPGVNLYCQNRFAELLNMAGEPIHRWNAKKGNNWHTVRLMDDGSLLAVGRDTGLTLKAWDDATVWHEPGRYHHDVDVDADGRILTLARRSRMVRFGDRKLPVLEDLIRIHAPDGDLLEEHSVFDLVRERIPTERIEALADWAGEREAGKLKHGTPADLTHANSARWLVHTTDHYRAGQVLLSVRELDTIAIVDLDAQSLVWAWGPGVIDGQHHATELGRDRILLFDNFGLGRGLSRILEVEVPAGGIRWQFRDGENFWSGIRGSVQRLVNGNTLISESQQGCVFEVTPEGERVWEWVNPRRHWKKRSRRAAVYRMERISDFSMAQRRLLRSALEESRRQRRENDARPTDATG